MKHYSKKLNLGCGLFPKSGFMNIDMIEGYPADITHNLEIFP